VLAKTCRIIHKINLRFITKKTAAQKTCANPEKKSPALYFNFDNFSAVAYYYIKLNTPTKVHNFL